MAGESAKVISEQGLEVLGRFYSVYRAMVVKNEDPDHMNMLQVVVPEIMGGITVWAYARNQHGSNGSGFKMMAPQIGDLVYVTFEYGDPSKPLWEYHGWGENQIPDILDSPEVMGIVTPRGNRFWVDDSSGTLKIYLNGDANIYTEGNIGINAKQKIYVSGSKVVLNQGNNDGMVNINDITTKLNNLVTELETLRNAFNSHVHTGVTTGPGSSGPTPTLVTKPFSQFKKEDYEDTKSVH